MSSNSLKIGFIGFGEAAQAFSEGLRHDCEHVDLFAFDIKSDGPDGDAIRSACAARSVSGAESSDALCIGKDVIFSFVTAEQAEIAAKTAAQCDLRGTLFFDCNSCAPNTKRRSAAVIEAAGGRYVDVAVMTPVHPKLHKAPCLFSGPHAVSAYEFAQKIGMNAENVGGDIGAASTRKMIRSIMIKGLEALTLECFLAARKAGIEADILASLEAHFPGFDWESRAPYMIERAATHGIRRAAEMDEVSQTLRDLELAPHMTERTVIRQREMGELGLSVSAEDAKDLRLLTDTILARLSPPKPEE